MAQGKSALGIVRKYHPNVTTIRDAKKGAHFEVTARDCKSGNKKSPSSCALANAACRKHDGAIISLAVAYLIDGNTATRYRVPSSIAREIVSFDRGQQFSPGTYKLNAPASTERLGSGHSGGRAKPKAGKRRGVRRAHRTLGIRTL